MRDQWIRETPLTGEQVAAFRVEQVKRAADFVGHTPETYTCDDCWMAHKCHLAFDPYNLGGDCLYEK
jgi:hypothetical protein